MMRNSPSYFKKLSWPIAAGVVVVMLVALIVVAATGGFFTGDADRSSLVTATQASLDGSASSQAQDRVAPTVADNGESKLVEPDPNFRQELERAPFSTEAWQTDFSRHTVPLTEINSAGPGKDGIPPLDEPKFTSVERADKWLDGKNPVIAFELNGDVRAYPLQILSWHEIVNDVVGGTPVTITFCPLCNTAVAFDRTLGGVVYDFGVTGNLRNSDLIMWDRQTESWWQQITGEAIVGELAGQRLTFIPAPIVAWNDFMESNPNGLVLSTDTGFDRNYRSSPYFGYDRLDRPPTNFSGDLDSRLQPKERVAAVTVGNVDVAFPFSVLELERVVNYSAGDRDIVVFFKPGTVSALDRTLIVDSKDVGSTGVFDADLDGRKLTFRLQGEEFTDNQTGSVWNILGKATSGPLAGTQLTPIVHGNHFWFAWGAFKPNTVIYRGAG